MSDLFSYAQVFHQWRESNQIVRGQRISSIDYTNKRRNRSTVSESLYTKVGQATRNKIMKWKLSL
jgi:hypothetical protein